jgi:cytochrome P450
LAGLSERGELVWVDAGRQRFLLVNGPEQAREVLIDRAAELVKPESQAIEVGPPAAEVVDESISVPLFRRALARGMSKERFEEILRAVSAASTAETAVWQDGLRLPLMPRLRHVAVQVACRASFASSLSEKELEEAAAVMRWHDGALRLSSPMLRRWQSLTPRGRSKAQVASQLRTLGQRLIDNADRSCPTELTAVVDDLPGFAKVTPDLQAALIGELLLGAAGPLTQASAWMLVRFASEEEAARKLRAEWASLPSRGPLGREQLERLSYTEAFLREVTRFHPTNARITRAAIVDTNVAGVPVPAQTRVILSLHALHRDPRYWNEPETFAPERWLENRPYTHKFSYIAFGAGGRRCLGDSMAMTALVALLPALLSEWDLSFTNLEDLRVSASGRRQLAEDAEVQLQKAS